MFLLTCISYKYDDDIVDDDGDFNDEDHVNDFIDDNDIKMALMMIIMVM